MQSISIHAFSKALLLDIRVTLTDLALFPGLCSIHYLQYKVREGLADTIHHMIHAMIHNKTIFLNN